MFNTLQLILLSKLKQNIHVCYFKNERLAGHVGMIFYFAMHVVSFFFNLSLIINNSEFILKYLETITGFLKLDCPAKFAFFVSTVQGCFA